MTATTETDNAGKSSEPAPQPARRKRINWFGAFWRWHFYGAIIVIPTLFVFAVTGLIYLYRAEIDDWTHPGVLTVEAQDGAVRLDLSEQQAAVEEGFPERTILSVYDQLGNRSTVFVTELQDGSTENVYVDPFNAVVTGSLAPDELVSDIAVRIHGQLLIGDVGDRIMELGASWAIVLTITGGIIFVLGRRPRRQASKKGLKGAKLRSAHAIVGLPVGVGILMLVFSGLPWTGVWGSAAQDIATQGGNPLWGEDPGAESTMEGLIESADGSSQPAGWAVSQGEQAESQVAAQPIPIDTAVAAARAEGAPGPYFVIYPDGETGVYSVMSSQWYDQGNPAESNVSLERTVHVDQYSGAVVAQYGYNDYSSLSRTVSQGIAIHEGRRFGPLNTILTTLFALSVIFMCVSAPIMWWRRRGTAKGIAAPRAKLPLKASWALVIAIAALGVFLPLFGISLVLILAFDQLVVRRVPALQRTFGSVS